MARGAGPVAEVSLTGAELSRKHFLIAFSLATSLFFLWGFSYGLIDTMNKHFQNVFGITRTESTFLQVAYFGAYLFFSPCAALFMKRFGYKRGIYLGLSLYALGAVMFWPCAVNETYAGFVACTFVTGCGLSCLEVAANSYVTVLGNPKYSALRVTLAQGFNGVGTVSAPAIGSKYFFHSEFSKDLSTVQWVYLAVSLFAVVLIILFRFAYLPEIKEELPQGEDDKVNWANFFRQYKLLFGFLTQFCYTGAQVGVASLAVNFFTEQKGAETSDSQGSLLLSLSQMTFTIGRFVSVPLLVFL